MEEALREIIGANSTKNVLIALVKKDRTNLGGVWFAVHLKTRVVVLMRLLLFSRRVCLPGEYKWI